MRVHLIGADLEENLALGILAAVSEAHGHRAAVVPFNEGSETSRVVRRAMAGAPDVIGLSIQFQHRAQEFLGLARRLRRAGYRGHITAGGQLPTLAWQQVLDPRHGVDSVVFHDGEETLVALLDALERGAPLCDVPGLAVRADDGALVRTPPRRLLDDLDAVPFALQYRRHSRHLEVPFIPILGGRGCWGRCSYCSIAAFYDDARASAGGGRTLRVRSPANVAAEMALRLEAAGGKAIFCFHDDNFLFPSERRSLERIRAIREALDAYGVGKVAMVGKARPDCLTPALARELFDLGVIRLYVGVENGSDTGGAHLGRRSQQPHVREALAACREAGIFVCYNLLVFEPEATLDDVRDNVRFIVEHAAHPVNFCRAEPYFGTLLHGAMSNPRDLRDSYLGFNYRIADDRVELLFRVCSAAFRERNFASNGVANRTMGLGYAASVLRHFYDQAGSTEHLVRRAAALTREISLDTAHYLEKAIALVERAAPGGLETIERDTARLGLEIAAADQRWHDELDRLYRELLAMAASAQRAPAAELHPSQSFFSLKNSLALGLSMAVVLQGCGCSTITAVDMVPQDGGWGGAGGGTVVDPPPPDGGTGGWIVDPVPYDAGGAGGGWIVDPPPPDAGTGGAGGGWIVDPLPPDGGFGALDVDSDSRTAQAGSEPRRLPLLDKWTDTSPRTSARSADLPLYDPPQLALKARREGEIVVVRLDGMTTPVTTRWEAEGSVEGEGVEVRWKPNGPSERVRVAIRSRGGVAVLSMRAEEELSLGV